MTQMGAKLLLANGEEPLSVFTGNPSDSGTDVVLVGRNNDSGTRLDTEAEAQSNTGSFGYGFGTELQEQPVLTSGLVTSTAAVGNLGYSSGGNVQVALDDVQATGMNEPVDANNENPFIFVGYLGQSDETNAIAGTARALSYDGVTESTGAVENGQYTFWAYEHLYYNSSALTSAAGQAFLTNVGNDLRTTTDVQQSGIPLQSMNVERSIEGGTIHP
jgi:hypothetical protein